MDPRITVVTLGVGNVENSERFYRDVLRLPRVDSPQGTACFSLGSLWLALTPRQPLADGAGVPEFGQGFRGFTLSHHVRSEIDVEILMDGVRNGGGKIVKPARRVSSGDYAGVFEDPDGFLWEVAWNPRFPHI